jgi:hypothetical protein
MKMTNNKKGVLRMKKFLGLFLVLALAGVAFAANTTTKYANSETATLKANHAPQYPVLMLYTANSAASKDTFAAGDIHIHGPYPLSSADGTPMFAGFQDLGDIITGTSPTMSLDFQVLPTASLSDTAPGGWVASDTLNGTGTNQYQSLASYSGNYIVFRVSNYDNTESDIPGKLYIVFKENWTYLKRF